MTTSDSEILRLSLREVTLILDALVSDCTDANGKEKAPSRKTLMQAKAALPSYCVNTFTKKESK